VDLLTKQLWPIRKNIMRYLKIKYSNLKKIEARMLNLPQTFDLTQTPDLIGYLFSNKLLL